MDKSREWSGEEEVERVSSRFFCFNVVLFSLPYLPVYSFSPFLFFFFVFVELESRFTSLLTHLSYPFRFQFSYLSHFVSLYFFDRSLLLPSL